AFGADKARRPGCVSVVVDPQLPVSAQGCDLDPELPAKAGIGVEHRVAGENQQHIADKFGAGCVPDGAAHESVGGVDSRTITVEGAFNMAVSGRDLRWRVHFRTV